MHNIEYPYGYTKEEVDSILQQATQIELETFFHGKKISAINMYCGRTKVKDKDLVAWMFWTVSQGAQEQKRLEESGNEFADKLNEYSAGLERTETLSEEDLQKEQELYQELEETLMRSLKEHNINLFPVSAPIPGQTPEENDGKETPEGVLEKFNIPWPRKPKPPAKD